jgi:hypothetical protein
VPELADFQGAWRLDRVIRQADGAEAVFSGRARFTPVAAGLAYEEAGQLIIAGQMPMQASRSYLWRTAGRRIAVDYADGKAFHDFDPVLPAAEHFCDPDTYLVRYDFAGWPAWRATWWVTGPRKDYLLISNYKREN